MHKHISMDQIRAIGHTRAKMLLEDYAAKFFAFHIVPNSKERFFTDLELARTRVEEFIRLQGY